MAKTNQNNKRDRENHKTSSRVVVNSILLFLMAVIFGVLTWCGSSRIIAYGRNHQAYIASDSPGICFEKESDYENGLPTTREGVYVCTTEIDENDEFVRVTDVDGYTMFLNDRISFAATVESIQLEIVLCVVGSMLTIASLISAIVYWNHNRG